jgi:hypothetical protein
MSPTIRISYFLLIVGIGNSKPPIAIVEIFPITSGGYSAIAFQGKIWVFGNEAWSSPDGNSWTRETGLDKHIVQPVVFADMVFGFQEKSLFYFTAQSVSWKKANPPSLFSSRYGATAAAFKNKIWLIGGTTNDAWSWGWE